MYRQDVQAGACTFSSQETEPAQVAGATESLNYLELKTELFELGERANAQPSPHATILSPRRKRPTPTNDGVRTVLHEAGLPELPANVAAVNAAINAIANGGMKHVGTELGGGVGMDGEYMCVDHSWAVDEDTAVEVLHQLVIGAMVSGMTVNRFWFEDARWRKAPVMHHGR
jgi:hypothetical protein